MLSICTPHEKLNNFRTAPRTVHLLIALPKKEKKKRKKHSTKDTEALKWQMRTNSPHSSFHKGEKQVLCFSMFTPRAATTLMVSCSWQQVQGLFSSGFHDASRGCAPRQCCPCSELVRLFSSPQTSNSLQEVLLFFPLVRSTEDNSPLLGLGGKTIRSDYKNHLWRWRVHFTASCGKHLKMVTLKCDLQERLLQVWGNSET